MALQPPDSTKADGGPQTHVMCVPAEIWRKRKPPATLVGAKAEILPSPSPSSPYLPFPAGQEGASPAMHATLTHANRHGIPNGASATEVQCHTAYAGSAPHSAHPSTRLGCHRRTRGRRRAFHLRQGIHEGAISQSGRQACQLAACGQHAGRRACTRGGIAAHEKICRPT